MHTSVQIDEGLFDVRIDGDPSTRQELFPDWGPRDRLGVVVGHPLGAVGASYLIQLAITAYYDNRPERRTSNGQYPEIYLFHAGQRFGDHSSYDFWPPRKEVFVDAQPQEILDAINDRAITRLALPEGPRRPVEHRMKEPATARDHIVSSFLYSPTGQVANPDITIAASDARAEENPQLTLETKRFLELMGGIDEMSASTSVEDAPSMTQGELDLTRQVRDRVIERMPEVNAYDRARAIEMRVALARNGIVTESYQRIALDEALERLSPS